MSIYKRVNNIAFRTEMAWFYHLLTEFSTNWAHLLGVAFCPSVGPSVRLGLDQKSLEKNSRTRKCRKRWCSYQWQVGSHQRQVAFFSTMGVLEWIVYFWLIAFQVHITSYNTTVVPQRVHFLWIFASKGMIFGPSNIIINNILIN